MKKRSVAILLAGILTVSTVCQSAYGAGTSTEAGSSAESIEARTDAVNASSEETDFEYYIKDDGTICIGGYTGSGGDVVIPDSIDGYPVTEIGEWAFVWICVNVSSITIPEGVTKIGREAFFDCNSLSSITIPEGVTIGESAFESCSGLSNITIPKGATIGESAFAYCENLSSVIISEGAIMGKSAFADCSNLSSVTILEGVTEIGESAFDECRNLSSVTIPGSVTKIGESAFDGCGLSSITIPEGVTEIGGGAFACTGLSSITIPGSVAKIGGCAFAWSSLRSITISEGVTEIGSSAFWACDHLSSVTIPEGVTEIEDSVFESCGLNSVTIPKSVTKIGSCAFANCGWLTDVYYAGNSSEWDLISIEENGNDSLKKATIHYGWEENSNSFYFQDNTQKYCLIGENQLDLFNGMIMRIGEENVADVIDNTVWTSSDPSVLEVTEASCIIEAGSGDGAWWLNGSVYRPGVVTITGTTNDGRTAVSDEISVEPEMHLSVSGPIKAEGNVICTVTLQEADAEYLESFISQLSMEIEDSSIVSVSSEIYEVAEDGLSATHTWILESQAVGYTEVKVTSAGGQNVSGTVETNKGFIIGRDNNAYSHRLDQFYSLTTLSEAVSPEKWSIYDTAYNLTGNTTAYFRVEEDGIVYYKIPEPLANYQTVYAEKVMEGISDSSKKIIQKKLISYWEGSCLGVEFSMIYAHQGILKEVIGNTDYYQLGIPKENAILRDLANYYNLCQYRSDFTVCNTYKNYWTNIKMGTEQLSSFLKLLVEEAKESQSREIPFVLGYTEKGHGGHAVIVCGYSTGSDSQKYHQLKIYDCNHQSDYLYMYVAKDYSSFSFQDGNGIKLGTKVDKLYEQMEFVGIDELMNAAYANPASSTSTKNRSTLSLDLESQTVQISVSAFKPFKLTNAEGETLIYDGENYSGTMQIYSNKIVGYANAELILTTDPSDSFILTEFEAGVEVTAEINGQFYDAMADGADKIVLSKAEGITITGDEYTFEAAISTDMDSCEMVQISGKATSITSITSDENGVHMDTELECSNVRVETYQGVECDEQVLDSTITSLSVTDDEETGDYILIEETSGVAINGTVTSYGNTNDTVTVSLMSGDEEVSKVEVTDGTYELTSVPSGTYTLQITKANHVTRTYDITVGSENITQDVKIYLIGDVTGDGKVNTRDLNRIYAHVNGTDPLTEYAFACGDVTGTDGKINTRDLNRLYAHINESNPLW